MERAMDEPNRTRVISNVKRPGGARSERDFTARNTRDDLSAEAI
jgi:hypothetical protein